MAELSAEAAEFAARLRELKERSGRSYGALAKQLHVSNSTLHRYCHGKALPAEFATVDRFARLCDAAPQERMALHRLWLLADAARGRAQGGSSGHGETPAAASAAEAAVAATAPGDASTAPPGASPNAPDSPGHPAPPAAASSDAPPPEDAAAPLDSPSPRAAKPTATLPGDTVDPPGDAAPPAAPAADPGDDTGAPLVTTQPPRATAEPSAERSGATWRRRRVLAVSLTVVCLVVLATAVSLWWGEKEARRTHPTGAGTGPAATPSEPGPSPAGSHSATPSPDGSSPGTPSRPSRSGSGTTSPDAPSSGTAPLRLTSRSHVWEHHCGHHYLLDTPPERVPPPPVEADAPAWASAQGAVHGGTTRVEVTVTGTGREPVVVRALHIRVTRRGEPLQWTSFAMDNGCGGALTRASYQVDLDKPRPVARPRQGSDEGGPIAPVELPHRVTASEPMVLLLQANTEGCDCSWYAELEWSAGGRSGTVRVDDDGEPFRTSATRGRPEYGYDYSAQRWRRVAG